MDEKISIIIPVYNSEKYIKRCIESILSQTYKNIEAIVVDDGSTDNSPQIIDEFAEGDSRVIPIHVPNGGVTKARLIGISKASGDLLCFCDSDDWYDEDMCQVLLDMLKSHNAQISVCGYKRHESGSIKYVSGSGKVIDLNKKELIDTILVGGCFTGSLCSKMFTKELFDGIEIDCSLKYNEDVLMLFYAALKAEKAVFFDKCMYNYFIHDESSCCSANEEKRSSDLIKVSLKMLKVCTGTDNQHNAQIRHVGMLLIRYKTCMSKKYYNKETLKETRKKLIKYYKENKGMTRNFRIHISMIRFIPHLYPLVIKLYNKVHTPNWDV